MSANEKTSKFSFNDACNRAKLRYNISSVVSYSNYMFKLFANYSTHWINICLNLFVCNIQFEIEFYLGLRLWKKFKVKERESWFRQFLNNELELIHNAVSIFSQYQERTSFDWYLIVQIAGSWATGLIIQIPKQIRDKPSNM